MQDFIPVSASVANRISEWILFEKRYGIDEKLPNEHDLAQELGVSRTSIREAVKTLAATGLLRVERGRGTFVAAPPSASSASRASRDDPFGVSYLEDKRKLAVHWFEMRLILEPGIVRLACERASEAEIAEIMACEQEAAAVIVRNEDFSQADQKFHAAVAKAARNTVVELMLPAMKGAIQEILRTSFYAGRQESSRENALTNHRLIAQFIEQRDGDGGALAMYYHIKKGLVDLQ